MFKLRQLSYADAPGFRYRLAAALARAAAGLVGQPFVTMHLTISTTPTSRAAARLRRRDQVDDLKARRFVRCLERVNGSIPLPAPAPRPTLALEAPARRPPAPPVLTIGTRRDKSTGEVIIGEITLPVFTAWLRPAPPAPRPTCPGPDVYRLPPDHPTAAAMLATRAPRCRCALPDPAPAPRD